MPEDLVYASTSRTSSGRCRAAAPRCLLAALVATAMVVLGSRPAVAAERFEKLVPASDAIAFFSIAEARGLETKVKASSYYRIWQEKEVQKFLEKPLAKLGTETEKTRRELGFSVEDVLSLPQGQVALAILASQDPSTDEVAVLLLVDVGSNADKAKAIVAKAVEKAVAEKAKRTERDFNGEKLIVLEMASAEPAEPADEKPASDDDAEAEDETTDDGESRAASSPVDRIVISTPGSLLLIANETAAVEKVLSNLKSPSMKSLADDDDFQKAVRRLGGSPDVVAYFSLGRTLELHPPGKEDEDALALMGISSIRTISGGMKLEPDLIRSTLSIGTRGEKHGLLRLVATRSSSLQLPKVIPDDVVGAGSMAFDLIGFLSDLESVMQSQAQEEFAQYQGFLQEIKSKTGVDLKADLIGNLGGETSYYTRQPTTGAGPIPITPFVILLSHKGKDRMDQTIGKLLALAPQPLFTKRDYNGVAINELSMGGGAGMPTPAYAITDEYLVFSIGAAGVEEVLRRVGKDAPSLLDSPRFKAATASLPQNRCGLLFSDDAKSIEGSMDSLRTAMMMLGGMGDLGDWIDFSLLPQASTISKHLGYTGSAIVQDADGLLFTSASHTEKGK